MKKILVASSVLLLTVLGVLMVRSNNPPTAETNSPLPKGVIIYDVRTREEFNTSHVAGAKLLPVQDIQSGTLPSEPTDTAIAVYCRSGNRSAQAASILKEAGFTNITDMGGLNNLATFGLKVQSL